MSAGAGAGAGAGAPEVPYVSPYSFDNPEAAAAAAATVAPTAAKFGEVFVAGSVAHSLSGRKDPPSAGGDGVPETNLYNFQHFRQLSGKRISRVVTSPVACHYIAIDADGGAYIWGRNERGQLGLGDLSNRYRPVKVNVGSPIVDAAAGKSHTLLVTAAGDVWACGDNKLGQLGLGKDAAWQEGTVKKFTKVNLGAEKQATACAAGAEFSVLLVGGVVHACGSPQYGQCGSGSTGEYIIHAGRTGFKEITSFRELVGPIASIKCSAIAAGACHGVALSVDGVPYSWGCGAYGRLGTGKPADEVIAKPVDFFLPERLRIGRVVCGATATFALTRMGERPLVYYFGITRKTGEATMKPTYIQDITSMSVRAIAIGPTSTLLAADTSVVGWGPSPTSGELGFGIESKSSTKPKLVDDLEGTFAIDVRQSRARWAAPTPASKTLTPSPPAPPPPPPPLSTSTLSTRCRSLWVLRRRLSSSTRRRLWLARASAQNSLQTRSSEFTIPRRSPLRALPPVRPRRRVRVRARARARVQVRARVRARVQVRVRARVRARSARPTTPRPPQRRRVKNDGFIKQKWSVLKIVWIAQARLRSRETHWRRRRSAHPQRRRLRRLHAAARRDPRAPL
jgi:hypothetical protein